MDRREVDTHLKFHAIQATIRKVPYWHIFSPNKLVCRSETSQTSRPRSGGTYCVLIVAVGRIGGLGYGRLIRKLRRHYIFPPLARTDLGSI